MSSTPLTSSATSTSLRGMARTPLAKVFSTTAPFSSSSSFAGFKLQNSFHIEDLQITVFDFKHEASCAQYIHLDTDDTNNAFCIGFRTPAPNSQGVTHVLEHSVLCGSQKYNVKDPFFHMTKRSFATFMNAMTGADYTLYPFSTTNEVDFQNLLSVYLDAVFNPLLRPDDFLQEAHRLERKNDEKTSGASDDELNELKFNGVVFNEMRGVASDPRRVFYQQLRRNLLPSTHYEFLSGGEPSEIVDMKHQDLVDFHRKYYCPKNSITMTYGDVSPLTRGTMKMLNEYFCSRSGGGSSGDSGKTVGVNQLVSIPRVTEWPLSKNKSWTGNEYFNNNINKNNNEIRYFKGPASMAGAPEDQTRVAIGWTIPPPAPSPPKKSSQDVEVNALDQRQQETKSIIKTAVEHDLIQELLMSGPASKMYKALVSEGALGASYSTGTGFHSTALSTPICSFGVESLRRGVEPQKVFDTVLSTIEEVCKNGFGDERRTQAAIFQEELSLRHRSTSRGINLLTGAIAMSLVRSYVKKNNNNNNTEDVEETTIDPCHVLDSLTHLREVSKSDPSLLLKELKRCTLDNMENSVKLVVEADKDFIASKQKRIDEKCKMRNEELIQSGEITKHFEKMDSWKKQREIETKEASAQAQKCLPSMKKEDISRRGVEEPGFNQVKPGVFVSSVTPTNGVVYLRALIPLNANIREVFEKIYQDGDNNNQEELLRSIFYWDESHSYVSTLGTSFADAEELDTLENLCSLGFSFSPMISTIWREDGVPQYRLGTQIAWKTTEEKLHESMKLFSRIVREANQLSSASSANSSSWEKSHKRFVTRLSSSSSQTVANATQRGHSLALSAAVCGLRNSKHFVQNLISDQTGGMKHLEMYKKLNEECKNQLKEDSWKSEVTLTPKLELFDENDVMSTSTFPTLIRFAKERDAFVRGLAEQTEKAIWWCICDNAEVEKKIVECLADPEINLLPKHHNETNKTSNDNTGLQEQDLKQLFDIELLSPSSSKVSNEKPRHQVIEFPTDTSFAALAKSNDELHPLHPHHPLVSVASQIAKSDFMHDKIRAESGAYGNFSSVGSGGTISHVSYRDPLPENSLNVFKKTKEWLLGEKDDGSTTTENADDDDKSAENINNNMNVNETNVEQALLRVFAGLDAPRTPASFGDRYFLHSITEEMRQVRRRRFLDETQPEKIRNVAAKYFSTDDENDMFSTVIVKPEGKSSEKK